MAGSSSSAQAQITVLPEAAALLNSSKCKAGSGMTLVTIFGTARTGKSFLMNAIAGEDDLFDVRPSNTPCTVGVDLCTKFVEVSHLLGDVSESTASSSGSPLAFIDVEGELRIVDLCLFVSSMYMALLNCMITNTVLCMLTCTRTVFCIAAIITGLEISSLFF